MLINQTLARSGFLGPNPIGTRVYAAGKALWEVVGIVEDVRQYGLDQAADPQIFIDVRQLPSSNPNVYFVVRAEDPTGLVRSIRDVVKQVSATAMVDSLATMDQLVSNSIARPRLYAMLLALFAVLAGALAVIGIYGVMAYAVARRTREIGIRIALGARRTQVIPVVLGESLVLTAAGIAAGLAGAAFLSRYLDRMLFGLDPLDPATFGAAAALFSFVAVLAAYVPARRATTVDPMVALRCE
jgi:ABC-type antimicrobial peptide transport system permease subunit